MKTMWNQRYSSESYVYGTNPNAFFKEFIDTETPGSVLLPAEGEGRNAVYAELKGWKVFALDYSEQAKQKANALAQKKGVSIHYEIADLEQWEGNLQVDCIGLFYAHMNPEYRYRIHTKLIGQLKPGGKIVLEAFNKNQLEKNTGGPKSYEMLFNLKMLSKDFEGLKITKLEELDSQLDEGNFHQGKASLIRMIAEKC